MTIDYKELSFLLGIDNKEAKRIIIDSLFKKAKSARPDLSDKEIMINIDLAPIDVIDICKQTTSFSELYNGKNIVQVTIDQIKKNGVSEAVEREILENPNCIVKCDLTGRFALLKKIMSVEQVNHIKAKLEGRRKLYLSSANKIPKNLKYEESISGLKDTTQLRLL